MSPEIKNKLAMLREVFAHSTGFQDWIAEWWARLRIDDRRLLLALAGLDESEEFARRPWKSHLLEDRDKLLSELKRIGRLIEALKWA